jgi:hypothetical protein
MRMILASLLFTAACSSAYADQPIAAPMPPGPRTALAIAPAKLRAPYDVQVVRENGETLPTYASKDRFYVQGNANERYILRVTNPTPNRVEAVVSVDGTDVIDGEDGDLHKRGYIVPAYGDVRIEGFRTSLADVATFRFSSVDGSYAGKKGKARNVGVIAVAIFEEEGAREQQQIVEPQPPPPPNGRYDWTDDLDASASTGHRGRGDVAKADRPRPAERAPAADKKSADPAPTVSAQASRSPAGPSGGYGGAPAQPRAMPARPPHHESNYDEDGELGGDIAPPRDVAPPTNRPGLGTEFGEQRSSAASYTRFVRSNARPVAIAELRYNDAAGLTALGILVTPLPSQGEIMTRETADPFPGDSRFSRAP